MTEQAVEKRRESARRSVTRDNAFPLDRGGGYFQILVPSVTPQAGLLPAWLPLDYRMRERVLDSTVRADAMWSAAIGIAITKAAALAWETKSDSELRSTRAQELLLGADATSISGIGGWVSYMGKQVRNFTCTNGGCFTEIIRATGAYGSKIVGLGHLSSLRMRRTGDPEYPFIYLDRWGRQHVMRWWQVFNLVDMPDPDESSLGMGICAAERAYQQIRKLAALEQYLYEKISGSRPLALHIVNGLTKDQLTDMMASASENQASKGLSLYMGAIVASTLKPDSPPSLVTIPLAELPDGFEAVAERDRADLIYANALGLDPQDLKPMSNQQMGAGAQSEVLNQKAEGRGQAAYRQQLVHMLNQLVFDDKTQFLFTEHDYRDQQAAANVSAARITAVVAATGGPVISAQQGLQVLVDQGEFPKAFIESGAQAGSDLSDTDKPGVNEPLGGSGPPQPTAQPVMQAQAPTPTQGGAAATASPAQPLVPKTTSTTAQPKEVFQKKALPPHHVTTRSVQSGARRILRQLTRKGSLSLKHGSHNQSSHGRSGGGGSGGKGKGAGAGGASGIATPKPTKQNVPVHGAGGQSKYPTLDAYKKGQISHSDALAMLQADIKTAKLSGDTKAVNTLNTQYYGLKKAGPKPSDQSLTNAPKMPAGSLHTAPGTIHPDIVNESASFTHDLDSGKMSPAKYSAEMEKLSEDTGHSKADLIQAGKAQNAALNVAAGKPAVSVSSKMAAIEGSPIHQSGQGLDQNIQKGIASQGDIDSFKANLKSQVATEQMKVDTAASAIESALQSGQKPLSSIVKLQTDAHDKIGALQALDKHIDASIGLYGIKGSSIPKPTSGPPQSAAFPKYVNDAVALNHQYEAGALGRDAYTQGLADIAQKHGTTPDLLTTKINSLYDADYLQKAQAKETKLVPHHSGEQYHLLSSRAAAEAWGEQQKFDRPINGAEQKAIYDYSYQGDEAINTKLRFGKDLDYAILRPAQEPARRDANIAHLDAVMARSSVPTNVTVHRGFSNPELIRRMSAGTPLEGAVFRDDGFVSTAVSSKSAFNNEIRTRINVPKGSQGTYIAPHVKPAYQDETELLLPRGSHFKISGYRRVDTVFDSYWELDMDYLGPQEVPGAFKAAM